MTGDQIEGEARSAAFFIVGDASSERALSELDAGIPLTDPERCPCGTLEIIDIEGPVGIGEPVRLEAGCPLTPLERRTSIVQEIIPARIEVIHDATLML
jgi:hypothetical protein